MVKIYKLYSKSRILDIYIGACTCKLNTRLSQHKWDGKNKYSKKALWIKSILETTNDLEIEEIGSCILEDYNKVETYYINLYKKTYNILNTDLKGNGIVLNRSLESVKKSTEHRNQQIIQLDKNLNFIREWDSISIVEQHLGILNSAIGNALTGRSISAGGFIWKYKNKETKIKKRNPKGGNKKKYYTIITNKETLISFDYTKSLTELAKEYNLSSWTISQILPKKKHYENSKYIFKCINK